MRGRHALVGTGLVRLLEAQSLEARVDAVRNAIWGRNENVVNEENRWFPIDVFDDFVIVRQGRRLLQVPYAFGADGQPDFQEPTEVEVEFRPARVQESLTGTLQLLEAAEGEPEGLEWDVVIIRPGLSLTGFFYPPETLREAAPLFEGVHVYAFDDDARGHKKNALDKTPRQLAGWIDSVHVQEGGAIAGRLHFFQEGPVDHMRRKLVDAWKRGKKDLMGLSIDAHGTVRSGAVGGRSTRVVESIRKALSVDVVLTPAAGGAFTRLVASAAGDDPTKEESMKKRQKLLRILEARRPDAYAGIDPETITIEQLVEMLPEDALQEAAPAAAAAGGGGGPLQPQPAGQGAADALQQVRLTESRILLRDQLAGSKLPELAQKRIQKRLADQVLTEEQIQEAIDDERDYLAKMAPARVSGLGGGREGAGVSLGAEKLDRLQAAFDRACGLEPENAELRTIKPIGLRGLYNEITLGNDPEVSGVLHESAQSAMLQEAFTNATLPRVVANTLHRRMVRDYRELDYGERRIINVVSAADFKTREAVRVGYFADLAAVNPESADYAELAAYGEESATYSVGQKGNLVTITRKHIINDDIGHVAKVVGRLGRAARRTFARFVWNFAVSNGAIYDTKAWFHADHDNLLTAPLSIAGLNEAEQLLFNQLELSSDEKLGLMVALLVVPIELKPTAFKLNKSEKHPDNANNEANPWFERFGAAGENILVNPFFTDANDYAVFARPEDGDIIEVAFLNGQEEPELFLADNPTVGQMFTADKLQYKIRHEYGGAVVDYRTAVKAVVA